MVWPEQQVGDWLAIGYRRRELRAYLEYLVEASYQGQGGRRVKNPRIWSLHELDLLTEGV